MSDLQAVDVFREAGAATLEALAAANHPRTYGEREPIWAEGDLADHLCLVRGGLLQVLKRNAEGDGLGLAIFGPGDVVGLLAVLDECPYPADAISLTRGARVDRFDARVVRRLAQTDPGLNRGFTRALVTHTRHLQAKIDLLSAGNVDHRLAALMLHLSDRFGEPQAAGRVTIRVKLTRRVLAELVGVRIETVIRTLSEWSAAGWFTTQPLGFECTLSELRARLGV